jgi:hypothetical protein
VEKEQELVDEVEQLRKHLDEVRPLSFFSHLMRLPVFLQQRRRLNRYLSRCVHTDLNALKRVYPSLTRSQVLKAF